MLKIVVWFTVFYLAIRLFSYTAVGNFAVPCVRSRNLRLRACGSVFFFAVADAVEPQNRWPSLSTSVENVDGE